MQLGLPVPQVYIVPVERFCREMGPALGVNLAEFEFPAYFNFFVYKKRCTLIVDSEDAEENIRRVFSETLLGPAQFRRQEGRKSHEAEDFADDFPKEAIPNFAKELEHFRIMPDGTELVIETLLQFHHFEMRSDGHEGLGVPPPLPDGEAPDAVVDEVASSSGDEVEEQAMAADMKGVDNLQQTPWSYSQARFIGMYSPDTLLTFRMSLTVLLQAMLPPSGQPRQRTRRSRTAVFLVLRYSRCRVELSI